MRVVFVLLPDRKTYTKHNKTKKIGKLVYFHGSGRGLGVVFFIRFSAETVALFLLAGRPVPFNPALFY